MKLRSMALGLAMLTALGGCTNTWTVDYNSPVGANVTRNWRVVDVNVSVPTTLSVSDQNSFAPNADIVWHGDPKGDRRAQVDVIMTDAIRTGAARLRGSKPVRLNVQMLEFHSVTPRSVRRAPAAVHNIHYIIQAFDARSGAALTQPVETMANLAANVGDAAITAILAGDTPKRRITAHVAAVTAGWLSAGPDPRRSFKSLGR